MIYFDKKKQAFAQKIDNYIATVDEVIWSEFCAYSAGDTWDIIDGQFVDLTQTEDYKAKKAQEEKERIAKLYLTGADVERGIYKAKGMDFEDIIAYVTQLQPEGLDIKALKIELKANNFYRGNPYVNAIGQLLGFTSEQLDQFFETNDYTVLLPKEEPTEVSNEENNEAVL